jgi:hypothetical protein
MSYVYIVWDIMPCSPLKINRCFGEAGIMLASFLKYSSSLKMEAICFSETSVNFQRTTRRIIPECRELLIPTAVRTSNFTYVQHNVGITKSLTQDTHFWSKFVFLGQRAGWPGFDCRQAKEIFLYSTESRPVLGRTQPLSNGYWVKLVTQFHLVPRPRMVALYLHSPIRLHGVVLN